MRWNKNTTKKKWSLAVGICGILLLLSAVLTKDSMPDKVAGIMVGLGSASFVLGVVHFLIGLYEEQHPEQHKLNEIEAKDERNGVIRCRSQAAAGTVLQWALIGAAWVCILADGPLWFTLSAVGAFGGKVLLEFALAQYYGRRM